MLNNWIERIRDRREYRELILNGLEKRANDSDLKIFKRLRRHPIAATFFINNFLDLFGTSVTDPGDGTWLELLLNFIKEIDWDKVMEILMFVLENILPLFMER
jgi:hypothetical protein